MRARDESDDSRRVKARLPSISLRFVVGSCAAWLLTTSLLLEPAQAQTAAPAPLTTSSPVSSKPSSASGGTTSAPFAPSDVAPPSTEPDDAPSEEPPTPVEPAPAPRPAPPPAPSVVEVAPPAPPPPVAPPPAPLGPPLQLLEKPAKIEFNRKTIYEIRVGSKAQPAETRARGAQKALALAIEEEKPESLRVVHDADVSVIYAGKIPVLQLFVEDARAHGHSSLQVHADDTTVRFRHLVEAEQRRKALATSVFSISLSVLMSLVALYLLGRTSDLTERARSWIETHRDKIPAIRVQSMELVGPGAMRSSTILGVEVAKWLLRFAIVYLWLFVSLSQFELTQGYVHDVTAAFFRPLSDLLRRLALSLPVLGVALIALGTVIVLVRFVELFFAGVARRETELPWIKPETAAPTSVLLRLGIMLSALLFGAPLVTGNLDGVLSRAGLVALLALGLAATPLLASLVVGISTVFGQKLKEGDWISFGGKRGRVVEVGLLYVVLDAAAGTRIRVPQLLGLFHPLEFLGSRARTRVEVPVRELTSNVLDVLKRAALSVGTQTEVEVTRIDAHGAVCRVSVLSDRADARSALFVAIARELEEAGLSLGKTPNEGGAP